MRTLLVVLMFNVLVATGCGSDDEGSDLLIETDYSTTTGVGGDAQFRVKWEQLDAGSQWEPSGPLEFYLQFQVCVEDGTKSHCEPIDLQQGYKNNDERSKSRVYPINRYATANPEWFLGFSGIDLENAARKLPFVMDKGNYHLVVDLWESDTIYDDHMGRVSRSFRELTFDTVIEIKDKASDAAVRLRFVDAYTENRDH